MTNPPVEAPRPTSQRQAVMNHTASKLYELESGISRGTSSTTATLARLRRAVNEAPGAVPEVWSITLGGLPEQLVGKTDAPSWGETAVHSALALFAIHQQGKSEFMHMKAHGLGTAVRRFIQTKDPQGGFDESSPVLRRFNALSTADSVDELLWHLRSLLTQLRSASISIDFVALAANIFDFHFPDSRDSVRLNWGRQLYAGPAATAESTQSSSVSSTS